MPHHAAHTPTRQRRHQLIIWLLISLPWVVAIGLALSVRQPAAAPLRQFRPATVHVTVTPAPHPVSAADLASHTGKGAQACWVAVNAVVYDIPPSSVWQEGQHVPSNGSVSCGQDNTSLLSQSPHGASVLKSLVIVGPLVQ